ncbi:hypothetical protein SCLCIDRAFT_1049585 [Scleroderma citrinum Foug A]|uniref:G-protein coupled receptors family 1 profile domain-containing protein n=1 Tax=Scleroderma citrinum Foug A TaxID=1036808 RepID=A0A0C3A2I2_9AGAM|nr:hypothetical protein SCLCIDRAFT_1049585 [Scleroderma citrinum Foug A]
MATRQTVPNPVVYLNYLETNTASQYEVTRNVYLVTLGALIWDILSNLEQDWQLLCTSKPSPVLIAYHVSRWGNFITILLCVLGYTGPIAAHCQTTQYVISAFCFVASAATDFLFLARVRAVYYDNKRVCFAFIFLWVVDVGVLSLVFTGFRANEIADTRHCMNDSQNKWEAAAMLMPLFFDTMVYIFITIRLISTRNPNEKKITWKTVFSGKSLPRMSRAVMRGGQQYYLIAMCCSVTMTICWLTPSVPVVAKASSDIPAIALTSSMACRIYRNLRLQLLEDEVECGDSSVDACCR